MQGKIWATVFFISVFSAASFGQTVQPATPAATTGGEEQIRQRRAAQIARESAENASTPRSNIPQRNFFPIKPRRNKEQQKRLDPSAEDLSRHSAFLSQPKTGVIRLMPDLECAPSANVVRADEQCSNYIPGSSFYSFREREYSLEPLSDIRYKDGLLISDGILSQGFLVNLGDVAPESVTLETEGMRFLNEYQPATLDKDATRQYREMMLGISLGRFIYRKSLPAHENATYGLRVVAYKGRFVQVFRGYRFDLLAGDARRDVTVVLRVVRKEPDGSVLLLWKELARRESPKVIYSKREGRK